MHRIFSRVRAAGKKYFSIVKKFIRGKKPLWFGPLIGGLLGLPGGLAGVIIGILLGMLIQVLTEQISTDYALINYFENPGPAKFREPGPGLAAFCGLGVIITLESSRINGIRRSLDVDALPMMEPVIRKAVLVFRLEDGDIPVAESFCKLAASRGALLNADLLAESLVARRAKKDDLPEIGAALESLAFGDGVEEARYIRSRIDPEYRIPEAAPASSAADPWLILGLNPAASTNEIKSTYRKLATQFHPDQLQFLDEPRRQDAEQAFMKIKDAYRQVMKDREVLSRT